MPRAPSRNGNRVAAWRMAADAGVFGADTMADSLERDSIGQERRAVGRLLKSTAVERTNKNGHRKAMPVKSTPNSERRELRGVLFS